MSLQVRANYINPLSMKKQQQSQTETAFRSPNPKSDPAEQLQMKRQQLQNQILLLKAIGTDTADLSAESQKELESALEEVTAELRAAKSVLSQPTEAVKEHLSRMKTPKLDAWETGTQNNLSFGSYYQEKDKKNGYQIIFTPYSET